MFFITSDIELFFSLLLEFELILLFEYPFPIKCLLKSFVHFSLQFVFLKDM